MAWNLALAEDKNEDDLPFSEADTTGGISSGVV